MPRSTQNKEVMITPDTALLQDSNSYLLEHLKNLTEDSVSPLEFTPIPSFVCRFDQDGSHELFTSNLPFRTLFDLHKNTSNTVEKIFPISFANSVCNRFEKSNNGELSKIINCKENVSLHSSICELELTLSPIHKPGAPIEYVAGSINKVNIVKELDNSSNNDLEHLNTAFNNLPGLVAVIDSSGNHRYSNTVYAKFFNKSKNELKSFDASKLLGQYNPDINAYLKSALEGDDVSFDTEYIGEDKRWNKVTFTLSPYINDTNTISGILIYGQRLNSKKSLKKTVEIYKQVNPLTKLLDRKSCTSYITSIINQNPQEEFGALVINLKEFKHINRVYGLEHGDELLEKVARRIESAIRQIDEVFYYGSDEFVCVFNQCSTDSLKISAARIQNSLEQPFMLGKNKISVSASYGSANYPIDGSEGKEIIEAAYEALYYAKENNRETLIQIDEGLNEKLRRQHILASELHTALENNEFYLAYQPIIDLRTMLPVGMEALIRWENKILGNVPPNDFIPMAEESDIIDDIGEWVLEQSCIDLAKIQKEFKDETFTVSVNTSARQFKYHRLSKKVKQCIEQSGIAPSCLELEITERQLIHDFEGAVNELNEITDMGVKLSIDDFGNGYSSFSTLRTIPFDTLKIDRSFIQDITCRSGAFTLVKTITSMTRVLGLNAIAEGIETRAQLNLIKNFAGCKFAQGFYFSRPIPMKNFTEYLSECIEKDS